MLSFNLLRVPNDIIFANQDPCMLSPTRSGVAVPDWAGRKERAQQQGQVNDSLGTSQQNWHWKQRKIPPYLPNNNNNNAQPTTKQIHPLITEFIVAFAWWSPLTVFFPPPGPDGGLQGSFNFRPVINHKPSCFVSFSLLSLWRRNRKSAVDQPPRMQTSAPCHRAGASLLLLSE
jgi:hypothetical protein